MYVMADIGQLSLHLPQRVQRSWKRMLLILRNPIGSRVIRRVEQADTQRPQPLQRPASICGTSEDAEFRTPDPVVSK